MSTEFQTSLTNGRVFEMKRFIAAFSLVEVVISIGVLSAGVIVAFALIPALARDSAATADALSAQQLPDPLRVELTRLATVEGFGSFGNRIAIITPELENGLQLVASKDALRVQLLEGSANAIEISDQYFLLECWRFADAPLSFDPSKGYLALHVRVSWPFRTGPSGAVTPLNARQQITFTKAINAR